MSETDGFTTLVSASGDKPSFSLGAEIIDFKAKNEKRKTIVFALESTLVSVNVKQGTQADALNLDVQPRPYLFELLAKLQPYFELVCISAQEKAFTEEVLSKVDGLKDYFEYVFTKEYMMTTEDNHRIYDLSMLIDEMERDEKSFLLIESKMENCQKNFRNLLAVPSFFGNEEDEVLKHLIEYLPSFDDVKDI